MAREKGKAEEGVGYCSDDCLSGNCVSIDRTVPHGTGSDCSALMPAPTQAAAQLL